MGHRCLFLWFLQQMATVRASQILKLSWGSGDDSFPLLLLFSAMCCSEGSSLGGEWLRTAWRTPAFWKMLMRGWMRLLSHSGNCLKNTCLWAPDACPVFVPHHLLLALSGGELAAGAKDCYHLFLLTCSNSHLVPRVLRLLFWGEETADLSIWWRCLEIRS